MKFKPQCSVHVRPPTVRRKSAFTLIEMIVSLGIGTLVLAGGVVFMIYAAKAVSAATAQTAMNQQASEAIQLIHNRIQLATLVTNDSTGNILTLGFDTNNLVDSGNGGGGVAWANQDYYEQFKFVGTNSTNGGLCATNQILYYSNTNSTNYRVLISQGVRNLPSRPIFAVTNSVLVTICFGLVDTNSQDAFQGIDIQAMSASLNRPSSTNMLSILPAP